MLLKFWKRSFVGNWSFEKDKKKFFFNAFLIGFFAVYSFGHVHAQSSDPDYPPTNIPVRFFSPNLDGVKDSLPIPLKVRDSNLDKWIVEILKKDGSGFSLVRKFESVNQREIGNLTARRFFSRLLEKDKNLVAPSQLSWDGRDEDGKLMPDGIYYVKIYAKDKSGNETTTKPLSVLLDTISPEATGKQSDSIFSPNNDGNKETLEVFVDGKNFDVGDRWRISFTDDDKKNSKVFEGSSLRKNVIWDGNNDNEKKSQEGRYKLQVEAFDLAGNRSALEPSQVTLVRKMNEASISLSVEKISPNSDGKFDDVVITPKLSDLEYLEKWNLVVYSNATPLKLYEGNGAPPETIRYSGENNDNNILPDGTYKVRFFADYFSGNKPTSSELSLTIDTTPPELFLELENNVFNPISKLEKGNKTVKISQSADNADFSTFTGVIQNANEEVVFKTDFKSKLPSLFEWDGKDAFSSIIAGDYTYSLIGEDDVGNPSIVVSENFKLVKGELKAELISSRLAFSPNGDEVQDRAVFLLKLDDTYQNLFLDGKIEILDGKKVIKTISLGEYANEIIWRGDDESGTLLDDGQYGYKGLLNFSTGESHDFPLRPIYIDRVPIEMSVSNQTPAFSPNGDNAKDELIVSHTVKKSDILPERDSFKVKIFSANGGGMIRENAWKGDLPSTVRWNGLDRNRKPVADGSYIYIVETEDEAGNRKSFPVDPFSLKKTAEKLELTLSDEVVSSHPDATKRELTLTPKLSSSDGLEKVEYIIRDKVGRNFTIGNSSAAVPYDWKGSPSKEEAIEGGAYEVEANATFSDGNVSISKKLPLLIDNQVPINGVKARPELFSPDGDGENENLEIRFLASDNDSLISNKAWVYRKIDLDKKGKPFKGGFENYTKSAVPFQTFDLGQGKNIDKLVNWDGYGTDGGLVESANDYIIFFESVDRVGLRTITEEPIIVDVFVERLPDGRLRIILNAILFKFDSAKMTGGYLGVLQKLIRILDKFPDYDIEVVGHTDSQGSDTYNEKLSTRRAKEVYNFLIKNAGIDKKRLSFKGLGERELKVDPEEVSDTALTDNERLLRTEDNYRKNRRVEFYLKKKEEK